MHPALPIDDITDALLDALRAHKRAVLQAPPGAGKTTHVPLAMLDAGLIRGRILMLEPRRLAARAAAERMAETLAEPVGRTVGYKIRGTNKTGPDTRIEVVTEGILTRMLQDKPDLPGVGAVIFDEFHERSLNADLGLALCLEVSEALRDDLVLLVMSATLDADPVAAMMNAPVLTSQGRSYPVDNRWLPRPRPARERLEMATARLLQEALGETPGSALVFLPGEGEIRRTESALRGQLPRDVSLHPLFGALDFKAQRAAIAPARDGRKVVLATAIAETSLTIEGIRIVIDAGRARRAEFDPASGMSRLITTRVSQAEATQRAGRAGRLAPGVCYKLWTRGEDGALPAFAPAEIDVADLTGLAMELAVWGAAPEDLRFVTPPHAGRFAEARRVLEMLGALDAAGRVTPHGRDLAALPLHPRLAHMVRKGGASAPTLAALLSERDILRGAGTDLSLRLDALVAPKIAAPAVDPAARDRVRTEARRIARAAGPAAAQAPDAPAILAALAYPDRVGLHRGGDAPRYVLSGGKGAVLPDGDRLVGSRILVATDLDGDPTEARVRQAAALSESDLRATFSEQIAWRNVCTWSRREGRVQARQQECFGALVLDDRAWRAAPSDAVARAMLEGVRQLGLRPSAGAARFLARARLMGHTTPGFPDFSDRHLMESLEDWLLPFLNGIRSTADWKGFDLLPALSARLDFQQSQALDRAAPARFTTPLGRSVPIDYAQDAPGVALRLQELFGVTRHPHAAGVPLRLTLLSPAGRPVQVTEDLPGFWDSSYDDVRKDMRGQYPKHPWPENPRDADPTLRAKPRKGRP